MNEIELYHHGILGQKWGVRRYQNKDGTLTDKGRKKYLNNTEETKQINKDDIVIKKGSIQSHVSGLKKVKLKDSETYLYDSNNEHDKKVYEGAYAEYLRTGKHYSNQYIHKYVVQDNLISPSQKRRVDIFLESYKNNPSTYAGELNYILYKQKLYKMAGYNLSERNENIANYSKKFDDNTSSKDLRKYGYDALNNLEEMGSKRSKAVSDFYSNIKNKGYNALVDDNNRSVYNDAVQPFITLNGKKTLKEINTYKLSNEERTNNMESLRDYNYKKYGSRSIAL